MPRALNARAIAGATSEPQTFIQSNLHGMEHAPRGELIASPRQRTTTSGRSPARDSNPGQNAADKTHPTPEFPLSFPDYLILVGKVANFYSSKKEYGAVEGLVVLIIII